MRRFQPFLVTLIVSIRLIKCDDIYLNETRATCDSTKQFLFCAKYRFLSFVSRYHQAGGSEPLAANSEDGGLVRLVAVPGRSSSDNSNEDLFGESRQMPGDHEIIKFMKFVQRQVNGFLTAQGLAVTVPDGASILEDGELVEESRGKKKKEMLIPLLMLFKLFKIKVLVGVALLGIFFIKKVILLSAFLLPSIIASVKNHCKQQQQYQVVPYHVNEGHHHYTHEHQDSGGGDGGGIGFGFSGYGGGKDWEQSKIKRYSYPYSGR